jgi:ATP-dependent protease ClpP protease subunit
MKYKYFKNITSTSADLYFYGAIVDEKTADWWTGEVSKTDIDTMELKEELDNLNGITDLNIFINSPGGSVFASSTMVSMLNRFRENTGAKIHSFVDGLCASASTYLLMVADDVNFYKNSMMMIHKPMSMAWGNANELQKEIDTLNTLEDNVMIPMYMNKSKVSEEEIKDLINNETWFSANPKDKNYIENYFNVNMLDETKEAVACVSKNLFKNYKNVPETYKNMFHDKQEPKQQKEVVENQSIDYSYFENKLVSIKK